VLFVHLAIFYQMPTFVKNLLYDVLTLDDEERNELKEIVDVIKKKADPDSSQAEITLRISDNVLSTLDTMLHVFMTDSEMAAVYRSVGADSFIGDTGMRLSKLSPYLHIMEEVINKISRQGGE
jgi:hypothetical protein